MNFVAKFRYQMCSAFDILGRRYATILDWILPTQNVMHALVTVTGVKL